MTPTEILAKQFGGRASAYPMSSAVQAIAALKDAGWIVVREAEANQWRTLLDANERLVRAQATLPGLKRWLDDLSSTAILPVSSTARVWANTLNTLLDIEADDA